jgi:hypothetical protein
MRGQLDYVWWWIGEEAFMAYLKTIRKTVLDNPHIFLIKET